MYMSVCSTRTHSNSTTHTHTHTHNRIRDTRYLFVSLVHFSSSNRRLFNAASKPKKNKKKTHTRTDQKTALKMGGRIILLLCPIEDRAHLLFYFSSYFSFIYLFLVCLIFLSLTNLCMCAQYAIVIDATVGFG